MSNIIELVKGDTHTCFNSTNILWINSHKLIVDGVPTPVDYDNSGFTLHNNKLYCRSSVDLMQFVYSVDNKMVAPLLKGKELPPEVMYLLTSEKLSKYNSKWNFTHRQDEKGITWGTEWDEEVDDFLFVILDQERMDFLAAQFDSEREELEATMTRYKELSDASWFSE